MTKFTEAFGNAFWQTLFYTSIQYYLTNEFSQDEIETLILNIIRALPCSICKNSAQQYLQDLGGISRYTDKSKPFNLTFMIFELKNKVNMKLISQGEKKDFPSFYSVLDHYLKYNPIYTRQIKDQVKKVFAKK